MSHESGAAAHDEVLTDQQVKPYLSHSQLDLFSKCGEAYRRRYLEKQIIPPGVALLRGSAVHGAAEVNHRQKIETGQDLPLQDLVDAAATTFDQRIATDGYSLAPDEQSTGAKIVLGKAKDSAVRLTGLYARNVAPNIEPELVEARVRVVLPESPLDLVGVIDVSTRDSRVKDLKTAARAKTQQDADDSLQLTWYDLTYRALKKVPPAGLDLEVLVDTATPKHQRLGTTRTMRDLEVLVARVNATAAAIKAGSFPPAQLGAWWCSNKFCGYFRSGCPFVNADRRAAAEI